MSATNRGAKRVASDFYATPLESIYSLLDNYDGIKPGDKILEPSAGNGNIIQALRDKGYKNTIDAIELRAEEANNLATLADDVIIGNFLELNNSDKWNVIIGNPPYSLAQEFIDKSLEVLAPGGRLIFLLRTNFFRESKAREMVERQAT